MMPPMFSLMMMTAINNISIIITIINIIITQTKKKLKWRLYITIIYEMNAF